MADQQQNQEQGKQKNKGKGGGGFGGQVVYIWRVGIRFYSTMLQEAALAVIFVTPLWIYFHYSGQETITIRTDFVSLVGITFFMFVLQNALFKKGG